MLVGNHAELVSAGFRLAAALICLDRARSSKACESVGEQRDEQKDKDCHRIPGLGWEEAAASHETMKV
ncbi:MAG TPA: hypothetical protein VF926_04960, partial [Mycobacterium sp.]